MTTDGPARRARLDRLSVRWYARHRARESARAAIGSLRPAADAERAERARTQLPWDELTPPDYLALHGSHIVAYTYDAYAYDDPRLQAWIDELGRLVRARDGDEGGSGRSSAPADPDARA